jgi:hypothetical protein
VARDEDDAAPSDLADHRRRRGVPVGRPHLDDLRFLQERGEARAPEDPDLSDRHDAEDSLDGALLDPSPDPEDEEDELDDGDDDEDPLSPSVFLIEVVGLELERLSVA